MVLFLAPAGLPADAKATLVTAFQAAATSPKLLALLATRNMGSFVATGDDIDKLIHAQSEQFSAALK
jgi:tripartite-type tricarboxylate transporter receptor subunit TctC